MSSRKPYKAPHTIDLMSIDTLTKRVVYVTFLDKPEIPIHYRGKISQVRVEGDVFSVGDDVLTGGARDYAAQRIKEIDENAAYREQQRRQPLGALVASEGGPGAWGIPVEAF